jgi:hypothetical protein
VGEGVGLCLGGGGSSAATGGRTEREWKEGARRARPGLTGWVVDWRLAGQVILGLHPVITAPSHPLPTSTIVFQQ